MIRKVAMWSSALLSGLYTTFVVQCFWNWFVAPIFHISSISFWAMFGLIMLLDLIFSKSQEQQEVINEKRWERAFAFLATSLPESKEQELNEIIEVQEENIFAEIGQKIGSKFLENTFLLIFGWFVYVFLV